jgi:hypothetical protein
MGTPYTHTQFGTVTAVGLGAAGLLCAWLAYDTRNVVPLVLLAVLLAALFVFATLRTSVRDGVFECEFACGLVRRRIPLAEIESVSVVHSPWYYGWGIRWTPHGWLWNVSGTRGVELRLRGGRRFRVGSDEPERLAEAIARASRSA